MPLDNDGTGQSKDLRDHFSPISLFEVDADICSSRGDHDGKAIEFGPNTRTQKYTPCFEDVVRMNDIGSEVSDLLDKLSITQSLGRQYPDGKPSVRKGLAPPLYGDGIACHRRKNRRAKN